MSRVDNDEARNPAKIFLEFSSDNSCFKYYDKIAEKQVLVKLPIQFMVLDVLNTVKGYNENDESGIWSNEINKKALSKVLTVRTRKGVIAQGTWKDIAEKVKSKGGKYAACVYIAYKYQGEVTICAMMLTGAALKEFFDFSKKHNIYKGKIMVTGFKEGKKGKVTYKYPVFTQDLEVKPESEQKAVELTNELAEYHEAYFKRNATPEEIEEETKTESKATKTSAPVNKRQAAATASSREEELEMEKEEGEEEDAAFEDMGDLEF